jgi:hypothetical protein
LIQVVSSFGNGEILPKAINLTSYSNGVHLAYISMIVIALPPFYLDADQPAGAGKHLVGLSLSMQCAVRSGAVESPSFHPPVVCFSGEGTVRDKKANSTSNLISETVRLSVYPPRVYSLTTIRTLHYYRMYR